MREASGAAVSPIAQRDGILTVGNMDQLINAGIVSKH